MNSRETPQAGQPGPAVAQHWTRRAHRLRCCDRLGVVAVGDIEQLRVASAGCAVQIGDAVGERVEQLGDDHGNHRGLDPFSALIGRRA